MLRGRYRLNLKQNFYALHNNISWHIQMLEIGKNPNQNMYGNAKKEFFEGKMSLGFLTTTTTNVCHFNVFAPYHLFHPYYKGPIRSTLVSFWCLYVLMLLSTFM
jgi:hypothetical protein